MSFEITNDDNTVDLRLDPPEVICDECKRFPLKAAGAEFAAYYCSHALIWAVPNAEIKHQWIMFWPMTEAAARENVGHLVQKIQ